MAAQKNYDEISVPNLPELGGQHAEAAVDVVGVLEYMVWQPTRHQRRPRGRAPAVRVVPVEDDARGREVVGVGREHIRKVVEANVGPALYGTRNGAWGEVGGGGGGGRCCWWVGATTIGMG